jgi:hypothetical protein
MQTLTPMTAPSGVAVLEGLREAHAALDRGLLRDDRGQVVGWASMAGLDSDELAEAIRLQASLEARMAGLGLHVLAAAEASDAKATTAATHTETWASRAAGRNRERSWGSLGVAQHLESTYAHVRAALAEGRITDDHARIIVRACEKVGGIVERLRRDARDRGLTEEQVADAVPTVSPEELAACERVLVDKALMMSPKRLTAAARRVLAPLRKRVEVRLPDVDPVTGELTEVDLALVVEDEQVRDAEDAALRETYLFLHERDDGCWAGQFVPPPLAGQALRNRLEHLTAPRRAAQRVAAGEEGHGSSTVEPTDGATLTHGERLGRALCEIIEHLPTDGFGRGGAVDAAIVVHIDEGKLRAGLGSATLATGGDLSASEARRLACNAGILPLVLSGDSVPIDLGRDKRLFSRHQAIVLSAQHDTCAAQDCERPFAWCELHHLLEWSCLGPTDLDNAVPLCGHHHRRIHDPLYEHRVHPDGSITFEHRWPSRRRRTWVPHVPSWAA